MIKLWKMLAPILVLSCLLIASASHAQGGNASATVTAREAYAKGQQLFRQGDFAAAQTSFEEAYRAVPNPIVLLSIAECQVRTEHFAEAVTSLSEYLTARPTAPDKAQVEAQIAKLREKPGFVEVTSAPAGARVLVDGVDSGKVTPTELGLGSGDHVIALELEGYTQAERTVTVAIGSRQPLEVTLEAVPAAPEPVAAAPVATQIDTADLRQSSTAMWVAVGVAGAGLVAGSILGGIALKNKSDFDSDPTEAKADKGERLALFADVGFGVAAAGAVTAIVLFVTSRGDKQEQAFNVAPSVAKNGAGLVGNLRF